MKKINVMVLTAGGAAAIGIIKYLKKQNDIPLHVIATDSNPYAAGFFFADEKLLIPPFKSSGFIDAMLSLCVKKNIQFVYPPSLVKNEGIELLSKNHSKFLNKGIRLFVINEPSLQYIINKKETIKSCRSYNIPFPKTFPNLTGISSNDFPIFVKPAVGGGAADTACVKNPQELEIYSGKTKEYIFQEYMELPEYTIDFLTDFGGKFIAAVPRLRQTVKNGQSVRGKTVFDKQLVRFTKHICEVFKIDGPGNIQVFKDERTNNAYLIEINPKFGSSSCLSFESGLNIPLLCIKLALGLKIPDSDLRYKEISMIRYFEEIYFED